mmetsp:Transcript_9786/g.39832  ORF Transcript_9786/g.39832 Transcript_9786/m.39832 type:complete len:234 (-) Transcript_9786:546-1247(-)
MCWMRSMKLDIFMRTSSRKSRRLVGLSAPSRTTSTRRRGSSKRRLVRSASGTSCLSTLHVSGVSAGAASHAERGTLRSSSAAEKPRPSKPRRAAWCARKAALTTSLRSARLRASAASAAIGTSGLATRAANLSSEQQPSSSVLVAVVVVVESAASGVLRDKTSSSSSSRTRRLVAARRVSRAARSAGARRPSVSSPSCRPSASSASDESAQPVSDGRTSSARMRASSSRSARL